MKKASEASIRRKALGINEKKNPMRQAQGKKGNIASNAKRKLDADNAMLEVLGTQKHHMQQAINAVSSVVAGSAKSKEKQTIVRAKVLDLFIEKSEDVAKRLVELSLGQGTFSEAPASVQRLAMMDVLRLAGISEKDAEAQAKDVKEMTREELIQFLKQAQAVADEVQAKQGITIDLEELK